MRVATTIVLIALVGAAAACGRFGTQVEEEPEVDHSEVGAEDKPTKMPSSPVATPEPAPAPTTARPDASADATPPGPIPTGIDPSDEIQRKMGIYFCTVACQLECAVDCAGTGDDTQGCFVCMTQRLSDCDDDGTCVPK